MCIRDSCWGGGQTFRFATNRPDLAAALVFYGPPPDKDAMSRIKAPVYGFYAGNDARIGATVPDTIAKMKQLGKTYEPVDVYKRQSWDSRKRLPSSTPGGILTLSLRTTCR